ncbi:MAG: hypothetical protein IT440_04005 [Phycisphaeraceae bacterium]|nr:hypothetical protein [Phycisphaeraceae bacterium]
MAQTPLSPLSPDVLDLHEDSQQADQTPTPTSEASPDPRNPRSPRKPRKPRKPGPPETPETPEPLTASELIRRVRTGLLTGCELTSPDRRRCVEFLTGEGVGVSDIAAILGMGEATIKRDRAALRRAGAIKPAPRLGDQFLGDYHRLVQNAIDRLRRLARNPTTPAVVRVQAERTSCDLFRLFMVTLHHFEYFDSGTGRINDAYLRKILGPTGPDRFDNALRRTMMAGAAASSTPPGP